MRAMALLWIGSRRNPDFATDYHLSPILAPRHLLAQLPPCLMQCGERDPFVDDTIIFAGRIKDAKRKRLAELETTLASNGARLGGSLGINTASQAPSSKLESRLPALRKERDKLKRQTEEDWVRMVLFSDWSHGYLQMLSLMEEAMSVVEELADWLNEAFEKYSRGEQAAPLAASAVTSETDDMGITFTPRRSVSQDTDGRSEESPPRDVSPEGVRPLPVEVPLLRPLTPLQKSITARQTGQKITETELMRRRRLVDSNIFGQ